MGDELHTTTNEPIDCIERLNWNCLVNSSSDELLASSEKKIHHQRIQERVDICKYTNKFWQMYYAIAFYAPTQTLNLLQTECEQIPYVSLTPSSQNNKNLFFFFALAFLTFIFRLNRGICSVCSTFAFTMWRLDLVRFTVYRDMFCVIFVKHEVKPISTIQNGLTKMYVQTPHLWVLAIGHTWSSYVAVCVSGKKNEICGALRSQWSRPFLNMLPRCHTVMWWWEKRQCERFFVLTRNYLIGSLCSNENDIKFPLIEGDMKFNFFLRLFVSFCRHCVSLRPFFREKKPFSSRFAHSPLNTNQF